MTRSSSTPPRKTPTHFEDADGCRVTRGLYNWEKLNSEPCATDEPLGIISWQFSGEVCRLMDEIAFEVPGP